ncbi:MAG: triple tyrosine motif-containing protein, partial [Bacteroidota bacterium]
LSKSRNEKTPLLSTIFARSDGLQGDNFLKGSHGIDYDKTIYVGGTNGFNYFEKEDLIVNTMPPKIEFIDLKINNKSVSFKESNALQSTIETSSVITLNHDQNVFTIEYIGINYTHPEKNQYAYKLDNFEADWNYVGNRRSATYTNLDPGTYYFNVKASNNDGIWNKQPTSIKIVILPAWWQTWWFRILTILMLTGLVLWLINYRSKVNRQQKVELKLRVKEATEEISKRNNSLIEQQKLLSLAITEINAVIGKAAESGDFSARISLDQKEGEWFQLASSMNLLFDTIVKPINHIAKIIEGLSYGNLSLRFEEEAQGDILVLKEQTNRSMDDLASLISSIQTTIKLVSSASLEMQTSSEEMNASTMEISSSISQISSGVNSQVSKVDEASHLIESIRNSAKEVSNQSSAIKKKAEEGNKISIDSVKLAEGLVNQSITALEKANSATTKIIELKKQSDAVANITSI